MLRFDFTIFFIKILHINKEEETNILRFGSDSLPCRIDWVCNNAFNWYSAFQGAQGQTWARRQMLAVAVTNVIHKTSLSCPSPPSCLPHSRRLKIGVHIITNANVRVMNGTCRQDRHSYLVRSRSSCQGMKQCVPYYLVMKVCQRGLPGFYRNPSVTPWLRKAAFLLVCAWRVGTVIVI